LRYSPLFWSSGFDLPLRQAPIATGTDDKGGTTAYIQQARLEPEVEFPGVNHSDDRWQASIIAMVKELV
jgi:hypothetical protein